MFGTGSFTLPFNVVMWMAIVQARQSSQWDMGGGGDAGVEVSGRLERTTAGANDDWSKGQLERSDSRIPPTTITNSFPLASLLVIAHHRHQRSI